MNIRQGKATGLTVAAVLLFWGGSVCAQGYGKGPPQADVNVVNMPDVNVANSPDVNVRNIPDVNVINDALTPVPVTLQNQVQTVVQWQYVGLTTHEDDGVWAYAGLGGIAAMNKACADDHGTGARAASIREAIIRNAPEQDLRLGWLVPSDAILFANESTSPSGVMLNSAFDSVTGLVVGPDPAPREDALRLAYCSRFQQALFGNNAPAVRPDGRLVSGNCNDSYPAACSAPFSVPVR